MWTEIPMKTSPNHSGVIIVIATLIICFQSCIAISLRDEFMLKDDEQQAFDRFKARVLPHIPTEYMTSDLVLIKYFRFCDMNETKAIERMKDNLKWRLDRALEEQLTEDDLNEYYREYPLSTFQDKAGRVVFFIATKYWDIVAAVTTPESTKKFVKFAYHVVEETYKKALSNNTNRTASGIVLLLDLKDVQLQKTSCMHCLEMSKELVSQGEMRWPGGIQLAYGVNGDPIIYQALNLLKNTLSQDLQKMCFPFDEDDSIWLPELLKIIDKAKLPAELYIRSQAQPGPEFLGFGQPPVTPVPEGRGISKTKQSKDINKVKKKKKDDDDDDDDE